MPFDVRFRIDLSLSDGAVRTYFQEQLHAGRVAVIITSMREADFMGAQSGMPSFFMKGVLPLDPQARAASLKVSVTIQATGDSNADGEVSLADWSDLAACLTGPTANGLQTAGSGSICTCLFDFDSDNDVDLRDVGQFQIAFSWS